MGCQLTKIDQNSSLDNSNLELSTKVNQNRNQINLP